MLLGDFNSEPTESCLNEFMNIYGLQNLIHDATCFKNPDNPSCIDLILTNHPKCFQNSQTVETGLSDFHKSTLTVLKMHFKKQNAKIILYRDFRHFCSQAFHENIITTLSDTLNDATELDQLEHFMQNANKILNKHAPKKQKYIRANQGPFMNKALHKEIMKRSQLRNKFLKTRTETDRIAYNKQRNYCVSLTRKIKKDYYSTLDEKNVMDNKQFWKTVKPFLSDKTTNDNKIILVENDEILTDNLKIAETFNSYFSQIVPELNISIDRELLTDTSNISDPVLKAIKK